MIDKKTFWIGIMTVVAAVLLGVHALQPAAVMPSAHARETVDSRDYAMATAEAANGGELLYILDKRSGLLALVAWDNQTRRPVAVDVQAVPAAFNR